LHCVYTLRYPWNNRVYWVGVTNNPRRRLGEHRRKVGFQPIMRVVYCCGDRKIAHAVEVLMIQTARKRKQYLKNKQHKEKR